jgi:PHD/YefM family antitoxin component YafN of YafNO toxin-antitoxin module
MRLRNVAELHNKTSEILREVNKEGYVVITSHSKPTAIIKKFSEDEIEDFVIENNPTIRESILNAYDDYFKNSGISIDKVIKELDI